MSTWLKQSTAVEIKLGPFVDNTDGFTSETGLTISQADVRLAKNGADWAQKAETTAAAHEENGWYRCLLDATDTDTLGILIVAVNETGALPVWREFLVLPAAVHDSFISGTGNGPRVDVVAISGDPTAADNAEAFFDGTGYAGTNNVIPTVTNVTTVNGLAANVITAASIANDAITDAKVAADVTIASVTGSVGSVTGAVGSVTAMVTANMIQISGDAAAADSFETMLDGTGGSDLSLRCLTITNSADASPALQITNAFNDVASRAVRIESTLNGGAIDITGKTRGVFISQDTGFGSAMELASTAGYGFYAHGELAGVYLMSGSTGGDYTGGLVISSLFSQAVYVKSDDTGDAVKIVATGGHGVNVAGDGSGKHGITSVGGSGGSGHAGTLAPNLLASYFLVDSGEDYSTSIAGSVVKEIADNAGGSLTVGAIADAVWDEAIAGHLTAGSTGAALNAAGSAGDPWTTLLPGAYGAGTAGFIVGTNLNATITSRMATYVQPTGFLAATFPGGTIANTTNITAGTITTVTNLTNAATAGDLTAAMKASVNTEVDTALVDIHLDHLLAVDYDPTAKPGVATALFNEIIGSDAGVSQFTANALELAPTGGSAPTVGQIADAVWDEVLAGHLTAGTTGAALDAAGTAGDPWTTVLPGGYADGTAGYIVGNNLDSPVSSGLCKRN